MWFASQSPLPESIADHDFVGNGRGRASFGGFDREERKEFRGDQVRANSMRAVSRSQGRVPGFVGGGLIEDMASLFPIEIVGRRDAVAVRAHGGDGLPERHDAVEFRK